MKFIVSMLLVAMAASAIAKPFDIKVGVTKQELIDRCNEIMKEGHDAMHKYHKQGNEQIFFQIENIIMLVNELKSEIPFHQTDDTLQMEDIVLQEQAKKMKDLIDELEHPEHRTTGPPHPTHPTHPTHPHTLFPTHHHHSTHPHPTTAHPQVYDESNEEVLKHAQEMIDHAKKVVDDNKNNEKVHFEIEVIQDEMAIIQKIMKEIKEEAGSPQAIALLKSNLKMHEDIMDKWVKSLEKKHLQLCYYDDKEESNEELLKHAQDMVDHAKKVIDEHKNNKHEHIEIEVIENEIIIIQNLMKEIKEQAGSPAAGLLKSNLKTHEDILDKWVKSLEKKH